MGEILERQELVESGGLVDGEGRQSVRVEVALNRDRSEDSKSV